MIDDGENNKNNIQAEQEFHRREAMEQIFEHLSFDGSENYLNSGKPFRKDNDSRILKDKRCFQKQENKSFRLADLQQGNYHDLPKVMMYAIDTN
ncbi:unnamed protein product [Paramecium sonneborni]|uniref:Uncharacterized protein n=1 Tax=Paramecium sonneborni TaxID=65129 RepID=A0A8S1K4Y8_9CILI|nr:unnamed protein product [Paramecium sonneborni]